ncbi:hypothetical protein ACFQ13_06770 [Winogradskyella rapida]|uniref:Outer membrane protein assembly factor BamA n=1 Tax=Winogradskyella rapida TaxID=549701 RepID=A0ABW3KP70_9FLAO
MPLRNRIFLFLTIISVFVNWAHAQVIRLEVTAENAEKTKVLDSIGYKQRFDNYKQLQEEVFNIKEQLSQQGYIDTRIDAVSKQNDSTYHAALFLGTKINIVRIYYTSDFDAKLLDDIKHQKGTDYYDIAIQNLESVLSHLNTKLAEQGDPFSTLQLIDLQKLNSDTLTAQLKVVSNKKRQIDKIIVKGYEKFPKAYIKHFLKLRTNQTFNLNEIKTKTMLFDNIRFAKTIKDPEVLFTNDSTSLYIYVEKVRTNNFDGFLGFGTNEDTNKIEFDGYLDLKLINNLNYGETINLYYKSDESDQQTFEVDADLPYLFSTPIGAQVGLRLFKKDSTFLNANQYAKLNYLINAEQKVGLGITTTNSTYLLEETSPTLSDYKTTYYTLNYTYSKPQYADPLFPINFWFDFTSGFGDRTISNSNEDQQMFTVETYKIFNLNNKNSIFTKLKAAMLNSDQYLDNELFRFGGINSIRGFEENSLVGNLYGVINTEYRYRLSNTLYVHSVLDAAYFENQLTDSKEKLFGFGFGLGLLTNAGLFKLNYSSGKTENQTFKLSDSKVHLSLTATF